MPSKYNLWSVRALFCLFCMMGAVANMAQTTSIRVTRLGEGPIIHAGLDPSIGDNIQGPSLIKVPSWVHKPLGKYYLYFADHKGSYIRLAYADDLIGPWQIHVPGSLQIADSHFLTEPPPVSDAQRAEVEAAFAARGIKIEHDVLQEVTAPHIASPDVHVDDKNRRIVMYFHGLEGLARQATRVATSSDGVSFTAQPQILGHTYFRAFSWQNMTYGLAMPGQFYRSQQALGPFVEGPRLFNTDMRHCAVLVRGTTLWVFWTQVGDVPEHVKVSSIDLRRDWMAWEVSESLEVLRPVYEWEGASAPAVPSVRSTAYGKVNQLRDPAVYVEDENNYLLYAIAGEAGIAIAKVEFPGAK